MPVNLPPIPDDKFVFVPKDAAQVLGVDSDTVTRHLAKRPHLFPTPKKKGRRRTIHEWTREQYADVLQKLHSLSDKAKTFVASQQNTPAMAV